MQAYTDKNQELSKARPAQEAVANATQLAQVDDTRSEASVQKKVQETISQSPMMTAQRQTIQKIFGGTAQRLELDEEKVGQKKAMDVSQLEKGLDEEMVGQKKAMDVSQLEKGLEEEMVGQKKSKDSSSTPVQRVKNETGMPDQLKSGVENLSGMSMDHVKVHYNSDKPAQLNALAYAQGSDIHVGAGQEQHLPHEAWHVVQQMQGRVQPTLQLEGVPVNDDVSLETEADVMGAKALGS
jgi:hypothetical protein